MIAGFGGLITESDGSRTYPGSGGQVGAYSPEGFGNYGSLGGAGSAYNVFTPWDGWLNNEILPDDGGCPTGICRDPGDLGGGDTRDHGCGAAGTCSDGGGIGPTGGGGGPTDTTVTTVTNTGGTTLSPVWQAIQRLLQPTGKTPLSTQGPAFIFTPQPGGAVSNGISPAILIVLAVVGVIGFVVYKKVT